MRKFREIDPDKSSPNLEEIRAKELKDRKIKYFWIEWTKEKIMKNFKITEIDGEIKVSLSWKKNLKAVVNWMREHMEAFPETRGGFDVEFIDGEEGRWYKVKPCVTGEKSDETINWIDYMIKSYNSSRGNRESVEEELIKALDDWGKK